MGKAKQALLAGLVSVAALGLGYLSARSSSPSSPLDYVAGQKGLSAEPLLSAVMPDLRGQTQAVSQWRGKVLVVNFWATWCGPCREEIPEFMKIQNKFREQGLVFIGIAVDRPESVRAYSEEIGINYPILLGELDAIELSRKAGNNLLGLPFTAIIDRSGRIAGTKAGRFPQAALESAVRHLL